MTPTTIQARGDAVASGPCPWVVLLGIILLVGDIGGSVVRAQGRPAARRDSLDLIPRYRMARFRLLAREFLAHMPLRVLPPERVPTGIDSLYGSPDAEDTAETGPEVPSFPIADVRTVRHLERSWYRNRFSDTKWAFFGSGTRLTFLDTTRTRDLRARLQAHFGEPTYTPAEANLDRWGRQPDSTRDDLVQFAYWFVVNDSIPVRVTDADGPTGRGLIVSTDRAYRDQLLGLRAALLQPLQREERAPYVDYYYNDEAGHWYRVGFDGQSFFRKHISRRDIVRGRRPRLETDRPAPASPDTTDASS